MKSREQLRTLFPMSAFGIVQGPLKRIRVNRLEQRLTPAVPFPHKHSFVHLLFLTKGSGWHEIDFKRWKVYPGALFLMRPAQVHGWMLSPDSKGTIIEFEVPAVFGDDLSLQFLRDFLEQAADHYDLRSNLAESARLFRAMQQEHDRQEGHFEWMIQALLMQVLIHLQRLGQQDKALSADRKQLLRQFTGLIEDHFQEHHEVAFYARQLDLSPKALTMRISRLTGRSARSFIQDRCLLEAKRLLAYSDLDIAQISRQIGFDDPSYFARIFKDKVVVSPRAFRERARSLS